MRDYQLGFRCDGKDIIYVCSAEAIIDAIEMATVRLEEQGHKGATLVWGRIARGPEWSPKINFELSDNSNEEEVEA